MSGIVSKEDVTIENEMFAELDTIISMTLEMRLDCRGITYHRWILQLPASLQIIQCP